METPLDAFANRADPDQAALIRAPDHDFSVCLCKYDIDGLTLVDLIDNVFVLCTNMKVYLYDYS